MGIAAHANSVARHVHGRRCSMSCRRPCPSVLDLHSVKASLPRPRFAQPALDPASVRIASRPGAKPCQNDSLINSGSRHGSRSQLPLRTALGLTFDIGLTLVSVRLHPLSLFAPTRLARMAKPSADRARTAGWQFEAGRGEDIPCRAIPNPRGCGVVVFTIILMMSLVFYWYASTIFLIGVFPYSFE
jgi:hypothetical protein